MEWAIQYGTSCWLSIWKSSPFWPLSSTAVVIIVLIFQIHHHSTSSKSLRKSQFQAKTISESPDVRAYQVDLNCWTLQGVFTKMILFIDILKHSLYYSCTCLFTNLWWLGFILVSVYLISQNLCFQSCLLIQLLTRDVSTLLWYLKWSN